MSSLFSPLFFPSLFFFPFLSHYKNDSQYDKAIDWYRYELPSQIKFFIGRAKLQAMFITKQKSLKHTIIFIIHIVHLRFKIGCMVTIQYCVSTANIRVSNISCFFMLFWVWNLRALFCLFMACTQVVLCYSHPPSTLCNIRNEFLLSNSDVMPIFKFSLLPLTLPSRL